ncbi:MAG: hypothetical protein AAF280_02945 [Pseudomonadota bacterium]
MDDGHSKIHVWLAGATISLNAAWGVHDDCASGRLVRVLPGYGAAEDNVSRLICPKSNVLPPPRRDSWIF